MRTASGQWKWILDRGKVVERDDTGQPIRATGTHLDIDDRKRAEQALRDSETTLRSIFSGRADGDWSDAAGGKCNGPISK